MSNKLKERKRLKTEAAELQELKQWKVYGFRIRKCPNFKDPTGKETLAGLHVPDQNVAGLVVCN
ncbi:MAG: hypothetical protein QW589_02865 [Candidatus Bathyarchaeia archaeon]